VREYDRSVATAEKNLADQHSRAPAVGEEERFVARRHAQALEHDLDPQAFAAVGDALSERSTVGEPRPVSACIDGRAGP
jgi:hypothetical protein